VTKHPDTTTVATTVAHPDHPSHRALLEDLKATVAGLFPRRESRASFADLVTGLLLELPRKNCWSIAEAVGHRTPDRLQHLLSRAVWDADAVLTTVAGWAVKRLSAQVSGPVSFAVDETGDAKSSRDAVGAAQQYSGSLGGIGLCQVAVHLSLVTPVGHVVIGRRLYLGAAWAGDDERRLLAGVPDDVAFATKPDLAIALLQDAVAAGIAARYVTADEVYGSVAFRTAARRLHLAYVVAVPANRQVTLPDRQRRTCADAVKLVPTSAWARMRTGTSTKGAKDYDWALLAVTEDDAPTEPSTPRPRPSNRPGEQPGEPSQKAGEHPRGHSVLLVRRHRYTRVLAFFRAWTPGPVSLTDLVAVVCARWHIEEDFQLAKRTTGLDQGQVRTWTSWHRWSAAALTAYAFLVIAALLEHTTAHAAAADPPELVPVSVPELQHLFAATVLPAPRHDRVHVQHWSHWRRHHQARARSCHQAWNAYADKVT
jgi:SRSO17 transposase